MPVDKYRWMSVGDVGELIVHPEDTISPKNGYIPSSTWEGMWIHCEFAGGHCTFITSNKVPQLILMAHLIGV